MSQGHERAERPVAVELAEAAATAGYAPSVLNTQPWRWRVLPDALELYAERARQLTATDPEAHLLLLSCGAALHHARLALAAQGWSPRVARLPDPTRPDLLATITPGQRHPADPEAMRLVQTMQVRHTDRRPLSDDPLPPQALEAVLAAVRAEGLNLHILAGPQVYELAAAAQRAATAEAGDERLLAEMAYWTHRRGPDGTGLPAYVTPATPAETTVPSRDFGADGTLPMGPGHDRAAVYGLLYGAEDEPQWWLRAGEALSAAWLTATALGVSVVPLSGAIEMAATRQTLRRLLAGLGYPFLALRLGLADPSTAGPAHTPRLPTAQVVDTSAVRDRPM